jgi:hypothetical protein
VKQKMICLTLVLATALLTMGAKWVEKPIDNLASIAGTWSGTGSNTRGAHYMIKYWFHEDGSFKFSKMQRGDMRDGQKGPGALWVEAGKLRYKTGRGPWTFTLYEKKTKHMLRGKRPDGNEQDLTPAK